MSTPEPDIMPSIDAFNAAIDRLGQLSIGALVIVAVMFGLFAFIVYQRLRFKSKEAEALLAIKVEENDTLRTEENTKILLQFGDLIRQVDSSREKAQDDRNDKTAQAIEKLTEAMVSANSYRIQQTEETKGLRGDLLTNQSAFDGKIDGLNTNILTLINANGRYEDMLMRLLKAVGNSPVEHAAVKEALDINSALLRKLVALLSPETTANSDGLKPAANEGKAA